MVEDGDGGHPEDEEADERGHRAVDPLDPGLEVAGRRQELAVAERPVRAPKAGVGRPDDDADRHEQEGRDDRGGGEALETGHGAPGFGRGRADARLGSAAPILRGDRRSVPRDHGAARGAWNGRPGYPHHDAYPISPAPDPAPGPRPTATARAALLLVVALVAAGCSGQGGASVTFGTSGAPPASPGASGSTGCAAAPARPADQEGWTTAPSEPSVFPVVVNSSGSLTCGVNRLLFTFLDADNRTVGSPDRSASVALFNLGRDGATPAGIGRGVVRLGDRERARLLRRVRDVPRGGRLGRRVHDDGRRRGAREGPDDLRGRHEHAGRPRRRPGAGV